jgi:pectate lyase
MNISPRLRAAFAAAAVSVLAATFVVSRADAATLFSDDFSDGNSSGWSASGGSWSVASQEYRQSSLSSDARSRAGQASWTDYTVTARVRPIAFNGANRFVAVLARAQSNTNYYYVALRSNNTIELKKLVGGSSTTLATAALSVTAGTTYTVSLTASGNQLTATVGSVSLTAADSQFASGQVGVATFNASAAFDDLSVTTGTAPSPTATASSSPSVSPTPSISPPPPIPGQADGFASVNAMGQNGTTGGAGGPTVVATTAAQLEAYVGQVGPLNIMVQGTIGLSGMITVVANKSIIGVGSSAHITGGGLQLGSTTRPGNNVIIRNLKFSDADDDSISVTNSAHHVWIDHNEFLPGYDGSLDIKRQSNYVTVSWNRFSGTDKSMLLGHSDGFTADIGYLKVSYHHNFFDAANQRLPRVRFGEPVHVYNNYYRNIGLYGVVSVENAGVVVEGNYFENVAFPCYSVSGYADSGPGRLVQRGNVFSNSGTCEAGGSVAEPSGYYGYTLTPAGQVPSLVSAGAGVGRL